jgi:hypothetical protein
VTGHSALVLPLEGLPSVVPPLSRGMVVPHVVLVEPFTTRAELTPAALTDLQSYFADVVPFSVRLTHLSELPDGSACLVLESAAAVRTLAHGLVVRFPGGGPGLARVPHVDVPLGAGSFDDLSAELEPWLPAVTLADEAALWWVTDGEDGVRPLASFPFGTSAA